MGYQLKAVTLCAVVEVPNSQYVAPVSTRSGGVAVHAVHLPLLVAVQLGANPVPSCASVGSAPEVARSAGSCSNRIAFGLIGLPPGPGAVGGVRPRANPRFSHSVVAGCQFPEASLYSTRR